MQCAYTCTDSMMFTKYRLKEIEGMKKNCPGSMSGIRVHNPLRHKPPDKVNLPIPPYNKNNGHRTD